MKTALVTTVLKHYIKIKPELFGLALTKKESVITMKAFLNLNG